MVATRDNTAMKNHGGRYAAMSTDRKSVYRPFSSTFLGVKRVFLILEIYDATLFIIQQLPYARGILKKVVIRRDEGYILG